MVLQCRYSLPLLYDGAAMCDAVWLTRYTDVPNAVPDAACAHMITTMRSGREWCCGAALDLPLLYDGAAMCDAVWLTRYTDVPNAVPDYKCAHMITTMRAAREWYCAAAYHLPLLYDGAAM